MKEIEMDIECLRGKIDELDTQILELLSKRSGFCIQIGEIKILKEIAIHSPEREKEITQRIQKQNRGPLSNEGVQRIFERIIDESRSLEKDIAKEKSKSKKEG